MSEPIAYKLKTPVQFGSQTITELSIRKPKAKDFRALPMEGATMGDILDIVGRLAAQPKAVIDDLEAEDMAGVAGLVAGFLPGGPGTGTKP